MIRGITGIGAGRGPMIVFADGFALQATSMEEGGWLGFMAGADRIQLDTHPYLCFGPPSNDGITYNAAKVSCFVVCSRSRFAR
jgi:glucan 1,3-beta-glucosidase